VDFLLKETRSGLKAVFTGNILVSALQGVAGGIGFALPWVNLPNPVLWGAVMALFALLPVVGAFMIWVPAGLYLIFTGNMVGGIFTLAWGAIVVTFVMDNIVKPKMIGRQADIHPMFVLVGVLGGAAVFGFIGLFLGPLLVGVTVAVLKLFEKDYLDPAVNLVDEHEERVLQADPDTAPLPGSKGDEDSGPFVNDMPEN
jgi:predicted PurR-regulated permease PerM